MKKILIIDNDSLVRRSLGQALREWNYLPIEASNISSGLELIDSDDPTLILFNIDISGTPSGLDALEMIKQRASCAVLIIMTDNISPAYRIAVNRAGAHGFITKPINLVEAQSVIRKSLETRSLQKSLQTPSNHFSFDMLIGKSPKMKELISLARKVAESDLTGVLLQGESGTGKDLIARAIHYSSDRADKPFLAINCAAIPANLIESELFGHEKGAFTDAKQKKQGLFEQAQGGTIFLDEIGEMDISLQAKLLRVLEENSFRRVGGLKDIPLNARIIAASNKDLKAESAQKNFRLDLYYRLSVIQIDIPPLRERGDDILLIAAHFIKTIDRWWSDSKPRQLAPEVVKVFRKYNWNGNVRELRNVIERASILEDSDQITLKYLPPELRQNNNNSSDGDHTGREGDFCVLLPPDGISLETVEDSLIRQALQRSQGNVTRAAELLHISRDQMRYYLKKKKLLESEQASKNSDGSKAKLA